MKSNFTLLFLFASLHCAAQTGLLSTCPESETVACIDAIPEADLSLLVAQTDCGVDYDGNPIDTASTNSGGVASCDTAYVACYSATTASLETLDNGQLRIEIEITYGTDADCKHAVSHVAFSLPEGTKAVEYNETDSYTGLLGTYNVENTTNNPYYSIKFESKGDGFEPGTKEIFIYTLPTGVVYEQVDILVKTATNSDPMTLSLDCSSEPNMPVNTVINYETFWIRDYVQPGGTGCIGDPIIITRSYGASDACYNSYSCQQEFFIESECVDGTPIGCDTDTSQVQGRTALPSTNIWQIEQQSYAVQFTGYEEHEDGYYSISKIFKTEEQESTEDPRELGRMPPTWQEEYEFAHESIEANDSILVEWIGNSVVVSGNTATTNQTAGIFPNPGAEIFTLSFAEELMGNASVIIYDQLGRLQQQRAVLAGNTSIHLDGTEWMPGLYYIQVFEENGIVHQATWIKR